MYYDYIMAQKSIGSDHCSINEMHEEIKTKCGPGLLGLMILYTSIRFSV